MAQLRITAGGSLERFTGRLQGAAFWFVYDVVQHPESSTTKTLPPSAVRADCQVGRCANLPEGIAELDRGCREYRESGHRPPPG